MTMKTATKKTKQGGEDATKKDCPHIKGYRSLEEYLDYVNTRMQAVRAQIKQNVQQERAP